MNYVCYFDLIFYRVISSVNQLKEGLGEIYD